MLGGRLADLGFFIGTLCLGFGVTIFKSDYIGRGRCSASQGSASQGSGSQGSGSLIAI